MAKRTAALILTLASLSVAIAIPAQADTSSPPQTSSPSSAPIKVTPLGTVSANSIPNRPKTVPTDAKVTAISYGPASTSSQGSKNTDPLAASAATSWNCVVYASDAYKTALGDVAGDGWQLCRGYGYTPMRIKVTIQRQTLGLFWVTAYSYTTGWDDDSYDSAQVLENCSKAGGTGKYRIITMGVAEGGKYSQQVTSLNENKINC